LELLTPTSYRFTGQRKDATIGLYFYNSRYYDPLLGRFIQQDAIVPSPGDPQSLNRYAYTLNNPVRYTDPSGHWYGPDDYDEAGIETDDEAIAWKIQYYLMACKSGGCAAKLSGKVPLVSQLDYSGKYVNAFSDYAVQYNACGEASATMALQYAGKDVNLNSLTDQAIEKGYYTPNDQPFTSPANLANILRENGATVFEGNAPNSDIGRAILFSHLDSGAPVIVDVTIQTKIVQNKKDALAHFVVVTELTVDNTVKFNDPYSNGAGASGRDADWKNFSSAWEKIVMLLFGAVNTGTPPFTLEADGDD